MRRSLYKTLRLKVIGTTLALAIGPLPILGASIYYQFGILYKERIQDQVSHLAKSQGAAVDVFLKERTNILAMIIETHSLEYLRNGDNLARIFQLINRRTEGLGLSDMGIIDGNGRQLAYIGPYDLKGLDYYSERWFDEVVRRGKHISDVFTGFRQVPHFIIAVKAQNRSDSWVLRATIDSDIFNQLVRGSQVGAKGDAYIVNRDGIFQTNPRFGGTVLEKSAIQPLQFGEDVNVVRQDLAGGDTRFMAGSWLKNNEWLLVISEDAEQQQGWMVHARLTGLMIVSTGCLVIFLATVLISHILVQHLEQTDRKMDELSAQLVQRDKLAALGKMAAGIAHEINNPLAVIGEKAGWMQDLLADEEFQDSQNYKEYAAAIVKIEEHVDRARKITHNMLGFARRMEPRLDDVEINQVLDQTIEILSNHARINGIDIRRHFSDRLPVIASDQSQLQQVFMNLINNAIDAIASNGTIDISTRKENGYIDIGIHDDGPGIPKAIQKKIFDPFFTTKHAGKGTGLGLSISYSIIEKMGGRISVDSHEGQGTTFVVSLPVVLPEKK